VYAPTEQLRTRRRELIAEGKAAAQQAANENRALSASEQTKYEACAGEIDAIDARLAEAGAHEQRARAAEETMADMRGRRPVTDRALNDQFRDAILEKNPRPIDVRGDSFPSVVSGLEMRATLTKSTANLYPVSFYSTLMEHLVETAAVLRAGATLITTTSGEDLRVPRSTSLSSAAIVPETNVIPTSDPGLGVVTLGSFKYGVLIQVSTELAEDAGFDIAAYLARETGVALGNALGNHLINGSGSGQPRGVILDASLGVTGPTGTSTSFGAQGTAGQGTDLIVDLVASLAEPYSRQPSSGFLTRTGTLASLRKLKETTGGLVGQNNFVAPPPAGSEAQASMAGLPVYVDPAVPSMAANAKSVLFGDWARYFVRIVNGVRFESSPDFAFSSDLITFRALMRADGALIDSTGAVKWFAHSAT
jgi:HK97 family phage major capsid protein